MPTMPIRPRIHAHQDRLVCPRRSRETLSRDRMTTRPTTLADDRRQSAATPTSELSASQLTSDLKKLAEAMTTTLSAELEGSVPCEIIAEIVRSVLDEGRRSAPDRGAEFTMREARQRLGRFIRARASI